MGSVFDLFPIDCNKLVLFFFVLGYSTNALSSVGVGKTSLDAHSHFRQPGR